MNINYLLSILFVILSCLAIIKINNFINLNKLKNTLLLRIYTFVLCIFCASFAFEIASQTLSMMMFFHTIKIVTLSFLPGLIFLVFFDIARIFKRIKLFQYILLFLIPLITAILILTAKYHSIFLYNFSIKFQEPLMFLVYEKGFWFYVFSAYAAGVMILLFSTILKWFARYKKQIIPLIILLSLISISIFCIFFEMNGSNLFLLFFLPFAIPLFSLILATDYISYKLFNSIPFAYKKAFEWSDNCMLILDKDLNLLDYNATAQKSIPLLSEKMLYSNIGDFIDYDGRIKKAILTDSECKTTIISHNFSKHYKVSSSALLDKTKNLTGYMVSLIDITELVNTMAELTELASVDALTRTYTRGHFIQRTETEFLRAKRHSHPLSFIILDLDFFKNINDAYGHLAGDAMLKEIADICRKKIRSIDLLGRFGGEEFMLLLPETDLEGAVFVAERIRKTIAETEFIFENYIMSITVSLGVTGKEIITDENFDTFLKYADRALYKAKDNGRNKVEYEACNKKQASK